MRAACVVRIGLQEVSAAWLDARDGTLLHSASADLSADGDAARNVSQALDRALSGYARKPGRVVFGFDLDRLAAAHVRVALADPYLRVAIMKFAKLPRNADDRALLISERFCREHRLEKAAFEVAAGVLEASENRQVLLCYAAPRPLIGAVRERLEAHDLYADLISPELLFGLQGAADPGGKNLSLRQWAVKALLGSRAAKAAMGTKAARNGPDRLTEGPGGLMLIHPGYATLALWPNGGVLAHVATLRRGEQAVGAFTDRLRRRLIRYAGTLNGDDALFALEVLADPGPPQELARSLAHQLSHLSVRLADARATAAEPFWRAMMMGAS
jgi:hypothetical protein